MEKYKILIEIGFIMLYFIVGVAVLCYLTMTFSWQKEKREKEKKEQVKENKQVKHLSFRKQMELAKQRNKQVKR